MLAERDRRECAAGPAREVRGIKVYVHFVDPTRRDVEAYDRWWRDVLARRMASRPGEGTGTITGD